MRLQTDEARARFGAARVARLATVGADGQPHIVPVVFAITTEDVLYSAVDHKPKTTTALKRLANVAGNPAVALLADHYADDWTQLWWVRADGTARIAEENEADDALAALASRYPAYVDAPPDGPVLAVDVRKWTGWAAS